MAEFENAWNSTLRDTIQEGLNQWNQLQVPYMVSNLNVTSVQLRDYRGKGKTLPSDFNYKTVDRDKVWSQEFENILAIAAISQIDQMRITQELINNADFILALIDNELSL